MARRYWEEEAPEVITSEKNVLRYYRNAGKLQVARPDWTDKDGTVKQGKAVALDLEALEALESAERKKAAGIFREILKALKAAD